MDEETSVLSTPPPQTETIFRTPQSCKLKQLITLALHTEEEESWYWGLSVF